MASVAESGARKDEELLGPLSHRASRRPRRAPHPASGTRCSLAAGCGNSKPRTLGSEPIHACAPGSLAVRGAAPAGRPSAWPREVPASGRNAKHRAGEPRTALGPDRPLGLGRSRSTDRYSATPDPSQARQAGRNAGITERQAVHRSPRLESASREGYSSKGVPRPLGSTNQAESTLLGYARGKRTAARVIAQARLARRCRPRRSPGAGPLVSRCRRCGSGGPRSTRSPSSPAKRC